MTTQILKYLDIIDSFATKRLTTSNYGKYLHCSVIFTKKGGLIYPLSYGENQIRGRLSIHAEEDCINKIPLKKEGKTQKVSILVMRITKSGDFTMSKPCEQCINKMNSIIDKNYKITSVYYTNKTGNIEKCSLNKLNLDPNKHVGKLFKKNGTLYR